MSERVARVEALLGELDALPEGRARDTASELVGALVDLYGEALGRIVARLDERAGGSLAEDELVAHLLLVHDLHPVPVEARVLAALDEVRPYLESHGGDVELVGVADGVAQLRLRGSCSGCPSSTMTLKLAIEDAIARAAPDVEQVEAEGVLEPEPAPALLQLEVSDAVGSAAWTTAGALPELAAGGTVVRRVAGERTLFARLDGTNYAYRADCAACGAGLERAELHGGELRCAGCGRQFDVRRAGRCLDDPQLFLEPVPLLVDGAGLVKIALPSAA